jgi:hypothetical protein
MGFVTGFSIGLLSFFIHYCTLSRILVACGFSEAAIYTQSAVIAFLGTIASLTRQRLKHSISLSSFLSGLEE